MGYSRFEGGREELVALDQSRRDQRAKINFTYSQCKRSGVGRNICRMKVHLVT